MCKFFFSAEDSVSGLRSVEEVKEIFGKIKRCNERIKTIHKPYFIPLFREI